MSKKREVVTAIKDLSASLFYKKVRGDDEEVPENRTPENRPSENRQPENRPSENRPSENRQPENRQPENRQPENRQPENRQPENRQPENRQPENRPSENRQPENRPSENRPSENRQSENRQPENRQFSKLNDCGKLKILVAELNFTAIGLLAILMEEFPSGRGHINFQQFADACHVAKSSLKTQIHILEQKGLIELGPIEQTGRDLTIIFARTAGREAT